MADKRSARRGAKPILPMPVREVSARYLHSPKEWRFRLFLSLALILGTVLIGVAGYRIIEGWPALDALYMTMITVTTIGYGEIAPLSPAGRLFTMALIVFTVGTIGYAASNLTAFVFEGEIDRMIRGSRLDRRINRLKDHYILAGCGSTGQYIVEEFYRAGVPFVVVEIDYARIEHVTDQVGQVLYILGDATRDETLHLAGIENARGLISAVDDDKNNLFIVLTARTLNPRLRIISRVVEEDNTDKLIRAGADDVISPNAIGGLRMASQMLRPTVVSFLDEMLRSDDRTLRIEEIHVADAPQLVGKTLGEAEVGQRTGLTVLAIVSGEHGHYQFNPGAESRLQPNDVLIVMGTLEQRKRLMEWFRHA